ncbi:MAG: hypothetical protein ACTSYO_02775 [Candidatus Ranarchaeia archaeon]
MSEHQTPPIFLLRFFLKHKGLFNRLLLTDQGSIRRQVLSTRRLQSPIQPKFEGAEGPMEEGMIYLLFASDGKSDDIQNLDSVYRLFWVLAPDLNYHQIDAFLISSRLGTRHWTRYYLKPIFLQSSRHWHQESHIDFLDLEMDGSWRHGYAMRFNDRINKIRGDLRYNPLSQKATLTYYNGRELVTPQLIQKFYDSFGLRVDGSITIDNRDIEVKNGRGLIEHGIGIFSTISFHEWKWLNLQFSEGSIHFFYHPLEDGKGGVIKAAEGAAVLNNRWYHFLRDEFEIKEQKYMFDDTIESYVPRSWRITAYIPEDKMSKIDLNVSCLAHYAWHVGPPIIGRNYVDYMLKAKGTWNRQAICGSGTMEYLLPNK